MSYDLLVNVGKAQLPTGDQISRLLPQFGFPNPLNLHADCGFFPLLSDGRETGFDVAAYQVTQEDVDDYLADCEESGEEPDEFEKVGDTVIQFSCKNDLEIAAARTVAEVIARQCHGIVFDPQTGSEKSY